MSKNRGLRTRLEARLRDIVQRVDRIDSDLRQSHDRDSAEQAIELENDEVLEGLDELGRAEVHEIRAALRRIEDGSFGFCVECRQPIDDKRLEAAPTAATCIACAR